MADFTIDVSRSKTSRINLGIQGENIIEHIIFNISSWIEEFGEGVAYIYAQRKGDENPYPVALDMDLDAGTATWTITDADTAIKGKGKAQLVFVSDDEDSITDVEVYSPSSTYSVGDYCLYGTQLYKCKTTISTAEAWTPAHWDAVNEVKKTRVYATTVQASLVSTSSENPDAYETWLEVLGGYTARIESAKEDIIQEVEEWAESIVAPVADVKMTLDGEDVSIVENRVAEIPMAGNDDSGYGVVWASYDEDNNTVGLGFEGASEVYVPETEYVTEYVNENCVMKPTHKQTFTAPATGSFWGYQIPYNDSYTAEDLLNFNAYFISETNNTVAKCKSFKVTKISDKWRYDIYFESNYSPWYPTLGDTFVVENMFTDTDGTLFLNM